MTAAAMHETPDERPLVSVVMIFLNARRFLDDAIRSVCAQTYARWELLLVDDGSIDGSSDIARLHALSDPDRVRYVTHPARANLGMSASRRLGVECARGEFIAFLDGDDVFLPEKLERQLERFREHPSAAMVYGPTRHWFAWTGRLEDQHRDVRRRLGVPAPGLVTPPRLVRAFLDRTADTPATCGVLIRRHAYFSCGGSEPTFVDMFEDQVLFYRLCLTFPVYVDAQSWDLYRQHPDSMTAIRTRAGEGADDYRPTPARGRFLRWLDDEFRRRGIGDPDLVRYLRRELWPYRRPRIYRIGVTARRAARAVGLGHLKSALKRLLVRTR